VRRRTGLASAAAGVGVAVFGGLGWLVGSEATGALDVAISTAVQQAEGALLAEGMQAISALGAPPLGLPVVLGVPFVLWRLGHRLAGRFALLGALGATVGAAALRQVWRRPRPTDEVVTIFGDAPAGTSFPSGHTLLYVTFFGFLLYWSWTFLRPGRLRTVLVTTCGLLIGLIGVSRIYLGHHWASDVLASYALGFAGLLVLIQLYARSRRALTPAALPTAGL
jgi:undecaprenyl-diphosphatase